MARQTRGQGQLPGAESMLRATTEDAPKLPARVADYLAISVQQRSDGTFRAMRLRLDPSSHRVVPELLDCWEQPPEAFMTKAEALLYWAQQGVLDERGILE